MVCGTNSSCDEVIVVTLHGVQAVIAVKCMNVIVRVRLHVSTIIWIALNLTCGSGSS